MGVANCADCTEAPVMVCGRCSTTRCAAHSLPAGERCPACERDYSEDARMRRAVKLMFAPPAAILAGGLLFGLLLPVSLGMVGGVFICALVSCTAVGAGAGTCRLVERASRAMFLRERSNALPPARLLASGRHR